MQGLKIRFKTDPTEEEPYQNWVEQTQKRHVNNLLPVLVKHGLSFYFHVDFAPRESEEDSPYTPLIVHTKCYWPYQRDEIMKKLKESSGGISLDLAGISIEKYPACEAPECFERIAGEKLPAPLFNRHGCVDDNSTHLISECCKYHLDSRSQHILKTIETIDETPGEKDHRVYIHVWPMWHRWFVQRVSQEWNYDGWENPNVFPYLVATPWVVGKTKEEAIEIARVCDE